MPLALADRQNPELKVAEASCSPPLHIGKETKPSRYAREDLYYLLPNATSSLNMKHANATFCGLRDRGLS